MKIQISASNAFANWLGLDLPRIPSPNGKSIGTQRLITNSESIAWQCHAIKKHTRSNNIVVIAVEAYSRYAIIMPYSHIPSQNEFENDLSRHWGNQMLHLMLESNIFTEENIPMVITQFENALQKFVWVKNTDLSVNGHVSNTEQWINESFKNYDIKHFNDDDAFGLGMHINQMFKKAKSPLGVKETFHPIPRIIDDGLFRFAEGLSDHHYPDTKRGNYPNPHKDQEALTKTPVEKKNNNVIYLSDYK